MNHVIKKIRAAELEKWNHDHQRADPKISTRIAKFAGSSIVGLDFNPELVKATKMNMVMNNDGAGGSFKPIRWRARPRGKRNYASET